MDYLNLLINYILQSYFLDSHCILIFTDQKILNVNSSLPVVYIGVNSNGDFEKNLMFQYFGCQGIIVHTENSSNTVRSIELAIRYDTLERFNQRRYMVIVYTDNKSTSYNHNLQKEAIRIFTLAELEYINDFLLIIYHDFGTISYSLESEGNANFSIEAYTHMFDDVNNTSEIIKLNEWTSENDSFDDNVNLYLDKLSNGKGKLFRIATFTYKPYSVPEFYEGTELQIAIEFCQQYNLTPYYLVDEEGEWGEIYDNWTGYGILGNIMNDHGDIGLGALYTWGHEYRFLDLSKPVVRTGITCLTPAPHLASGWLVPFFSFTYVMWIAVGLTFLVCSIVATVLDYYALRHESNISTIELFETSVLDTASIFLLQAFDRFGNSTKAKTFLHGCMFLFSILIASSYSSGLASSMTVPRYVGAILTVQELVDSGIQWGATSIAWIMSIMEAEEYNYKVLVDRFVKTDGPRLQKYNNKRFAFSVERLPAGQFAIGEYITEEGASELKLMHEDLYWEQCVLMTKKSSIWTPKVDEFVLHLAQTGIPQVWEYRVATKHLNPKIQKAVQYGSHHTESSTGPVKLHWGHVQGTFGILLLGLGIASICFIIEILTNLTKRKSKVTII